MDDKRILELAIEALEARRNEIEAEIERLKGGKAAPAGRKRGSATRSKAVSEAMKAYWARKKGMVGAAAVSAKSARGPQSEAARKAQSERMKTYWKKRKAEGKKK